jgi:hypothetical protein
LTSSNDYVWFDPFEQRTKIEHARATLTSLQEAEKATLGRLPSFQKGRIGLSEEAIQTLGFAIHLLPK